ncbi:MAG: hypothetical protein JNM75_11805 [Rhodospirillales bacterium]|nr:hypothetical protein [Rhodospirillales bacterium]
MRDDGLVQNEDLADAIYDSVREPERLREVMTRFANELGSDAAYFKIVDNEAGEVAAGAGGGLPEGSDRDYLTNYLASDVRVPRVNKAPRRLILDDRQLISPIELRSSAFHREFLPRYDLAHLLHVNISRSPQYTTILTCGRSHGRGAFETVQSHILAAYVPHFEESCDLHLRLLRLGGFAVLMSAAFDALPVAGIILDGEGRIIFINAMAKDILGDGDGFAIRGGRLTTADPRAASALQRALRRTPPAGGGPDAFGPVFPVRRPSSRPDYRLELRPLPVSCGFRHEDAAAMVLALISDPAREILSVEQRLRRDFRLTPAESALAMAVASGTLLREYAERRGVTIGTVRFQMKQVLAKTGSRRQSDLVRLVGTGDNGVRL